MARRLLREPFCHRSFAGPGKGMQHFMDSELERRSTNFAVNLREIETRVLKIAQMSCRCRDGKNYHFKMSNRNDKLDLNDWIFFFN